MYTEIDMSGRVEETHHATAIGLVGAVSHSIFISAKEKRKLITEMRKVKSSWSKKRIHIAIFSTLLFFTIRDVASQLSVMKIDPEYTGYEHIIRERVIMLCQRHGCSVSKSQITFVHVGKKSPAHDLAYKVLKRKKKPNQIVTAKDVLGEF